MTYLLDTCILSKLRKIKLVSNKNLELWIQKHTELSFFISAISVGEIQKGISKLKDSEIEAKRVLENWLIADLVPRFEGRVLVIDAQVALIWGELCGRCQKKGILLPVVDSLLAASAIRYNLILVTENVKDFIHTEVRLFNPLG
jgi:predicted nucleic acid-binding protein